MGQAVQNVVADGDVVDVISPYMGNYAHWMSIGLPRYVTNTMDGIDMVQAGVVAQTLYC